MAKILVIAPHHDDETLGVGGTMAKHVQKGDDVTVCILTTIDDGHPVMKPNKKEIYEETKSALKILGVENFIIKDLPNVLVADQPMYVVNKAVYECIASVKPDILYIPFINDLHKDHREIVYASQVAARSCTDFGRNIKEIYMYETLSETHWNIDQVEGGFLPNVYIEIDDEILDKKIEAIKSYKSQLKEHPNARSVEALRALAVVRGSIAGFRAAEAFMLVRKLG